MRRRTRREEMMGEKEVQSSEHEASGESGSGGSEGVGMDTKAEEWAGWCEYGRV
jgi:hypothetical protein